MNKKKYSVKCYECKDYFLAKKPITYNLCEKCEYERNIEYQTKFKQEFQDKIDAYFENFLTLKECPNPYDYCSNYSSSYEDPGISGDDIIRLMKICYTEGFKDGEESEFELRINPRFTYEP